MSLTMLIFASQIYNSRPLSLDYRFVTPFILGPHHRTVCWTLSWCSQERSQEVNKLTRVYWDIERRIHEAKGP